MAILLGTLAQAGCVGVTTAKSAPASNGASSTNPTPSNAPSITAQPASQSVAVGQAAVFTVTAAGTTPISYQWQRNGAAISGATAASYTTAPTISTDNGGQFSVAIGDTNGTATSSIATLTVTAAAVAPSISVPPASQTVTAGQSATFSVTATGTSPLIYQWQRNGAPISGATSASYMTAVTSASDNAAQFSVAVSNSVSATSSAVATLTVTAASSAPSITSQPTSQTITVGQTATFSVVAAGTAPLTYQWQRNGAPIVGAAAATYATSVTTASDNGARFTVTISNSAGTVTSNVAALTVNAALTAPIINTQPAPQAVGAGQTATFSVMAGGTGSLTYQWQKNSIAIAGATSAVYTTPVTTISDNNEQFAVVVGNAVGSVTSTSVSLTVSPAPVVPSITSQPASQTITVGQTATFAVSVSGASPLTYTWQKNGVAINSATSASYATPAAVIADNNARFTVTVSNAAGSVTSNAAILTVNATAGQLSISTSALSFGSVITGSNSTLPVTFTNSGGSAVTISNVTLSGAGFTSTGVSAGLIVSSGQTATLNVSFAPAAAGSVIGSVVVASNGGNSPASISLSGTGVQPVSHAVTLNWSASTSTVQGYNVYRSIVSGGPYTVLNTALIAATDFVNSTVTAGQTYYYVVTAVDSTNTDSAYSAEVAVLVP